MDYMGSILAMVICIAMSAYFSATETAFSSLNKTRLKVLADNGNRRAALTLKLAGNYDKLISTILIGNNIVNILVASIGTLLFVGLYGDMGATISTVVVTVVVLIFGEITPKSVAKDAPERFAMVSAPLYSPVDLGADAGEFSFFPVEEIHFPLFQDRRECQNVPRGIASLHGKR